MRLEELMPAVIIEFVVLLKASSGRGRDVHAASLAPSATFQMLQESAAATFIPSLLPQSTAISSRSRRASRISAGR